jgi:hypothetical protein
MPADISAGYTFPEQGDIQATSGGDLAFGHRVEIPKFNGLGMVYQFVEGRDPGGGDDPYQYAYGVNGPISFGDRSPSDQGDKTYIASYTASPVAFEVPPRFDYTYRDHDPIPTPQESGTAVWVGEITGGEGKLYDVDIFKKGLDGERTALEQVAEAYRIDDLKLLPGERVLVIKSVDKDGETQYQFVAASGVSFPVKVRFGGVTADLFLQGKDNDSILNQSLQIPQLEDDVIPEDTWLIGVRSLKEGSVIYTIQPPVWLLDDTPAIPEE